VHESTIFPLPRPLAHLPPALPTLVSVVCNTIVNTSAHQMNLSCRYATAGALAGATNRNRLRADCNSGFKVRYRSVPTVQSGYTTTH